MNENKDKLNNDKIDNAISSTENGSENGAEKKWLIVIAVIAIVALSLISILMGGLGKNKNPDSDIDSTIGAIVDSTPTEGDPTTPTEPPLIPTIGANYPTFTINGK